jgi:hypothetical protein
VDSWSSRRDNQSSTPLAFQWSEFGYIQERRFTPKQGFSNFCDTSIL